MRLRFLLTLLIIGSAVSSARADHRAADHQAADHRALVDKWVQPLIENEALVGCVVGIIDGDQREVYGFGETKLGSGQRPDGRTIYEIGSVTKAFTGTLLADMVNRGEVRLNAPLQKLLPADVKLKPFVNKQGDARPIRLVDVASQSSGLPRMPSNFAPKDPRNPYADYTSERMFDFLRQLKLDRPPGKYEYSNLGMGLLGYVLAERAGKSYEQLVVERICNPLHMNDTRITLNADQRARFAPPYNGEGSPDHAWDFPTLAGAGALRSTANDLLKFIAASLAENPNQQSAPNEPAARVTAAIHKAWEKQYGDEGEIGVGLGWHIARDGVTRWHNGQTGGYGAALFIYPPRKLGVVVLTNTGTDVAMPLAERILQSLLGMQPPPLHQRKTVEVPAKILKTYVGHYALGFTQMFTITLDKGQLWAQLTGQDKFRLFPESETKFFYRIVDAQITFVKDDKGQVTKLVLHQNGMDQTAVRVQGK